MQIEYWMTDAMPPNSGGRSFVKKLCPESRGRKMRKTAMPPNSGAAVLAMLPNVGGRKSAKLLYS